MIVTIYKFKDITSDQQAQLITAMKELNIPHDLEVIDYDNSEVWDDLTSYLYKEKKKAANNFKERIFKLKNNIK